MLKGRIASERPRILLQNSQIEKIWQQISSIRTAITWNTPYGNTATTEQRCLEATCRMDIMHSWPGASLQYAPYVRNSSYFGSASNCYGSQSASQSNINDACPSRGIALPSSENPHGLQYCKHSSKNSQNTQQHSIDIS